MDKNTVVSGTDMEVDTRTTESHFVNDNRRDEIGFGDREDLYWVNMIKSLGEQCRVMPIACIEANNGLITEVQGFTLRNSLKTMTVDNGEDWWVGAPHGYKMGRFLQHVFKEMIIGLASIAKKRINFIPTLDSIVFGYNEYTPKLMFRNVMSDTDTAGNSRPQNIWKALGNLVEVVVVETSQVYGSLQLHPEVIHFRRMLLEDCKAVDCERMIEHPSLVTDKEVLDFIMQYRESAGQVVTMYKTRRSGYRYVGDWEAVVSQDERTKEVLDLWRNEIENHRDLGNNKPVQLAYFFQSVYQHINSKHFLNKYGCWYDYDQLALFIDMNFPKFATYLFKCYVEGERLFM